MFGKDKDDTDQAGAQRGMAASPAPQGRSADAPSIISADMKVVGDLQSGGDVQVEGSVEGDIKSRTVTVGEQAHINGSIHSDTANIRGRITGKVHASAVRIAKSANVQGDINYQTLSIEEGAVIDGQIRRKDAAGKSEAPKKSEDAAPSANVAPIKPSGVAGASGSSAIKPSGGKPLAR